MHIYQNQNLYINIHIYPFSSPENACRPVRFLTGALSSLRAAAIYIYIYLYLYLYIHIHVYIYMYMYMLNLYMYIYIHIQRYI